MFDSIMPILVSGITLGALYALMSVGLALVWGGLGVLNLTQGAMFMVGAYTAYVVADSGFHITFAILAAIIVTGLLGVLLYLGPLRFVERRADRDIATILLTLSLATILENLALLQFGPRNRALPELVGGATRVMGTMISHNVIMMTVVAIVVLIALSLCINRTRLGIAIRAVAQHRDGAKVSGINSAFVFAVVLFLSSALAGLSGVLLSSYYFISPYVGSTYLLTALIITLLGGLGSLNGTLFAAFLVGIVQASVSFYFGVRWSMPVLFFLIMAMLVFRPNGISGVAHRKRV